MNFKEIRSNILRVAMSRGVVIFLGMLTVTIIARYLGPVQQGKFSYISLTINILVTIFSLGLPSSVVYYIGKSKNEREKKQIVINSNFILAKSYLIGVSFCMFAIFLAPDELEIVDLVSDKTIFILIIVGFLLRLIFNHVQHIQIGFQNFTKYNITAVAQSSIYALLVLMFMTTISLSAATAIISLLISLLVPILLNINREWKKWDVNYQICKKLIVYGVKSHLNNVISFLMYRTDLLMIGYFLGVKAFGLYSIVMLIIESLQLLTTSAATVLFSHVSHKGDGEHKVVIKSIVTLSMINLLIVLIIFVTSEYLVTFLFGDEYYASIQILNVLVWVVFFSTISRVIGSYFAGINKLNYNLYLAVILFFANMILNVCFITNYGLIGAPYATLLVVIANAIIKTLLLSYYINGNKK